LPAELLKAVGEAIDAAFAEMAHDEDYQEEAQGIAEDFARADW